MEAGVYSLQTKNGGRQEGSHAQDPHRVLLIFSISKVSGKSHSGFESQHHSRYGKKRIKKKKRERERRRGHVAS